MLIRRYEDKGPEIEFRCEGVRKADALVIVPEPHEDGASYRFLPAIDYEGGSALTIGLCPFCGTPAEPSERRRDDGGRGRRPHL